MVAPRRRLAALAIAMAAALGVSATVAVAQQDEPLTGGSDDALLERLGALEADLPADPAPTDVTIEDDGTWGDFEGDITGATAILGTLEPDLTSLYVDADDAEGAVAEGVAAVARGWLDLQQGLDALAVWEAADLAFPVDAEDADGVATDADALRGQAETGLRLVLEARQRHLTGYVALRELGAAAPEAQSRLDARAAEAEAFDQDLRPRVKRLLSLQSTEVIVPVDRFETDAPGVNARAKSFQVTCVDREVYAETADDPDGESPSTPDASVDEAVTGGPRADCPDAAGVDAAD